MLLIPSSIIFMAVLPAIVLFIYIYKADRYKEPLSILIWTFLMGMLSAPASTFFSSMTPETISGGPFLTALYTAVMKAAIPEELTKFLFLYAVIWHNRNFDEMFDGIVYASVVGLGFAALENIMYVMNYGTGVLLSRGLLAVPGHFFFGVAMGFFFGIAKFNPGKRGLFLSLALIVPIFIHGCYDFLLMWAEGLGNWFSIILTLFFYWFVTRMWKFGFKRIQLMQGR